MFDHTMYFCVYIVAIFYTRT